MTFLKDMTHRRICLLIDDDADDQEIFILAMAEVSKDFQCIVASSGGEALTMMTGDTGLLPDYIFLDLNMPRMNGKECLIEIKKNKRLRNVPVIMYTTSSSLSDKTETRNLGASEFITKPHSIVKLTDVLCAFFRKQKEPILC
jgi:DNA-binding response OmpR family regulator